MKRFIDVYTPLRCIQELLNDVNNHLNVHLTDQDISFELYAEILNRLKAKQDAEILNRLKAKQDNEILFQETYKRLLSEWLYTINQMLIDHNPLRYIEGDGCCVLHDELSGQSIKISSEAHTPFVFIE